MQHIFCVTSATASYCSVILCTYLLVFLSGETDRVWLTFQKGSQVKLSLPYLKVQRHRCPIRMYCSVADGEPAAADCLACCMMGTARALAYQERWKTSAPCICHAKIAHCSFVLVDMTDYVTMCAFWRRLSKVFLKDIATACLRQYLMLLLYDLSKSPFCSPLVRVEGR